MSGFPCHSETSPVIFLLLWHSKISKFIFTRFCSQSFCQGTLNTFSGEWYLETKISCSNYLGWWCLQTHNRYISTHIICTAFSSSSDSWVHALTNSKFLRSSFYPHSPPYLNLFSPTIRAIPSYLLFQQYHHTNSFAQPQMQTCSKVTTILRSAKTKISLLLSLEYISFRVYSIYCTKIVFIFFLLLCGSISNLIGLLACCTQC